jgi:hypothetical protein
MSDPTGPGASPNPAENVSLELESLDDTIMRWQGSPDPAAALNITLARFRKVKLLRESGRMVEAADCFSLIGDRTALAGMRNGLVRVAEAAYVPWR